MIGRRKSDKIYFRLTLLGIGLSSILSLAALYAEKQFLGLMDDVRKSVQMRNKFRKYVDPDL